jgi:murein DD-endopeptidase MepM/ murein hydrolase activator NlpD
MDITLFCRNGSKSHCLHLNSTVIIAVVVGLPLLSGLASYHLKPAPIVIEQSKQLSDNLSLKKEIAQQKQQLNSAVGAANKTLDSLALKLGQVQAKMTRVEALGTSLVEEEKLDNGEFDFNTTPPIGGLSNATNKNNSVVDFVAELDALSSRLDDRYEQLNILEDMMLNAEMHSFSVPSGRPILKGWLSSHYGKRKDPFSGKDAIHHGLDFAGKEGSSVVATASGIVIWSGKRYGYGNLVEIDHGNHYVTRYAHNKENLVKLGDYVEKGKVLALMGSTGRSTGPHVHYEVLKRNRHLNPKKYVKHIASNK